MNNEINPALEVNNVSNPEEQPAAQASYPPINQPIPPNADKVAGYKKKHSGILWILCLLWAILIIVGALTSSNEKYNIVEAVLLIIFAFGLVWNQVEDKGAHLLLTWGPLRWCLCGMGKEKIKYLDIIYYSTTKTCFYWFGIPYCTSLKLFTTCGCRCKHKIVRLSVKETYQGMNAGDKDDCCLESCCLKRCYGESAEYIGSGCCCRRCCNPCGCNCCVYNTVNISTDDAEGLIKLLHVRCPHLNLANVEMVDL